FYPGKSAHDLRAHASLRSVSFSYPAYHYKRRHRVQPALHQRWLYHKAPYAAYGSLLLYSFTWYLPIGTTEGVPEIGSLTTIQSSPKISLTNSLVITSDGFPSATSLPSCMANI